MRFFTLLLDPNGQGIPDHVRRSYEVMPKRRGLELAWKSFENAAVLTAWNDSYGDPLVVQHHNFLAAGTVRLDNRADLERWSECKGEELTDLGLVLRIVARHGTKYIPRILGDFGFVVWDGASRTAVAACDAFAVQPLYYADHRCLTVFASRAEALALEERYEAEYLVRVVALHGPPRELSVYAGVRPVPAASWAVLESGRLSVGQYWSATSIDADPDKAMTESEAVEACRSLLIESIRLRLASDGDTWAQLSGGLDSSSVVSLVQWLARKGQIAHGLAGTVTFVDRQATASDEREYSDAVVRHWGVRNHIIADSPTWHDPFYPPPLGDQPGLDLQFYPRDSRLQAVMQASGARVLLTGWGGDEVFVSNMFFYADWIAHGHFWKAAREMTRRAATGRVSAWELAYKNALLPLLPAPLQRRLVNDGFPVQPWLNGRALRQYGLTSRAPTASEYAGPLGSKSRHAILSRLAALENLTNHSALNDSLQLRHPMLYRPLVEFALTLPPSLRARPYAHRWVLRESMRGIVPEKTRVRIGKQATGSTLAWSMATERGTLAPLLGAPFLAELGVINAERFRAAVETPLPSTRYGQDLNATLASTLAVEAWLQMRSGRWPCEGLPNQ
jgi:asparagine synthase (glutamine-hydrolysing)